MRLHDVRLYRIWTNMKHRCSCPTFPKYADYGGRGIGVCDEWVRSFPEFKEWAESNGYADDLELDRIDNDLGYSPENCRFASRSVQVQNTRKRSDCSSGYRGVTWNKRTEKWRAQICKSGCNRQIGSFDSEREAALAYDNAALSLYGETARLNFAK